MRRVMALAVKVLTFSALDVLLAELCVGALFVPSLLFELASGGYDLPIYLQWLRAPKHTDAQALDVLTRALGALPADYLGPHTFYASVAPWFAWLGPVVLALWAAGTLWLMGQLALPPGSRPLALGQHHTRCPAHIRADARGNS